MNNRARGIAVSTVGYLCLAIGGWMLSMTNAAWYSHTYSSRAILFPLAAVLAVMGILAFVQDRGLDAVVFFGGGALLGTVAVYFAADDMTMTQMTEPLSYIGWFACVWALYFAFAWAGSLRAGVARSSFLGGMFFTLGCLAIAAWSGFPGWLIAAGYVGLITSILAFAVSGTEIRRLAQLAGPNNLEVTRTSVHPMAAD